MKRGWWILKFLVFGIVMLVLIGLVTQMLWNWLVPELFAGPILTFWQALGLLALSKILFWSFGKSGGHWRSHQSGPWAPYWAQKWKGMSPEDRERLKEKMKEKWCYTDKTSPTDKSDIANG